MVASVYWRLKALEQEESSSEALKILYDICVVLLQKRVNTDMYAMPDGVGKELLKKT